MLARLARERALARRTTLFILTGPSIILLARGQCLRESLLIHIHKCYYMIINAYSWVLLTMFNICTCFQGLKTLSHKKQNDAKKFLQRKIDKRFVSNWNKNELKSYVNTNMIVSVNFFNFNFWSLVAYIVNSSFSWKGVKAI